MTMSTTSTFNARRGIATLDAAAWHWAHTSGDPVIVAPLTSGPHKLLIELADADHKVLAQEVVK
jgi:hypothetical protein